MKLTTPLPAIFLDCNICLLDAFALWEQRTPQRTVRNPNSSFLETQLSSMKERALSLRLNGELHSFVEIRGNVSYLPGDSVAVLSAEPPPHVVAVQMIGGVAERSGTHPTRVSLPPTELETLDPPRMVAIRRVTTKSDLTLLLIDEGTGDTIAVIGTKIHWDLAGLKVRFETPAGVEVRV
jgi:hypothetical protein